MEIAAKELGLAGSQTDTFTSIEVIAGDTPPIVSDYGILGSALAATGIPAWTPVYVDPETRAITVTEIDGESSVYPNAITQLNTPAGTVSTSTVQVWKAGMFNVDALNWAASFNTDALKFGAFAKEPGQQIYVKRWA